MPEREVNRKTLPTVEEFKQEFRSHLLGVEFGSSDYTAFCDFFALENQRHARDIGIDSLRLYEDPESRLIADSELRITETRIAILESEIERKQITSIDYYKSYNSVEEKMEQLREAIANDVESKRPNASEASKKREKSDIYWGTLVDDFRDVLYRFYH
jgi:hypothetical protein